MVLYPGMSAPLLECYGVEGGEGEDKGVRRGKGYVCVCVSRDLE